MVTQSARDFFTGGPSEAAEAEVSAAGGSGIDNKV
jgi:hypothetical protein